jgi:hypothetical protein
MAVHSCPGRQFGQPRPEARQNQFSAGGADTLAKPHQRVDLDESRKVIPENSSDLRRYPSPTSKPA